MKKGYNQFFKFKTNDVVDINNLKKKLGIKCYSIYKSVQIFEKACIIEIIRPRSFFCFVFLMNHQEDNWCSDSPGLC